MIDTTENVAWLLKPVWVYDGVCYASMNAGELRRHQVDEIEDKVSFKVCGVDNQNLHSHAGIFISISGQKLIGGEPFEALELQKGRSADEVLLDIRKSLAKLANRNIKTL